MSRLPILAAAVLLTLAGAAPALSAPAPGASGGGDNPGTVGVKAPVPVTGQQVYQAVCQACHMADAKGGTGAGTIPALAGNPKLLVAAYPITLVLRGRGAMPWFNDSLTPDQIAGVVGYIRTNFGNNYPAPVTAADVVRMSGGR
jgi:mono/diheme cytochrome c family protein